MSVVLHQQATSTAGALQIMPIVSASQAVQPDNTERLLSRRQSGEGLFPDPKISTQGQRAHTISEREWVSQLS